MDHVTTAAEKAFFIWENALVMVNVLKFCTPKCLTKWHMQTVQEQSDLGLLCHSTKCYKKELHKKQNLGKKSME